MPPTADASEEARPPALVAWFLYDQVTTGRIRWDFLVLLGLMVAVKLGFMAWYTLRD